MEFTAAAGFDLCQGNASEAARQWGQAGDRLLTASQQLADQVILANPAQFRVVRKKAAITGLPPASWPRHNYRDRRVLFLMPAEALGENVATLLFLDAFRAAHAPAAIGLAFARSAADIYLAFDFVTVYPLWISRRELKQWDVVVDLNQVMARREIEFWPVDMEAELLGAFGIPPSEAFSAQAAPLPADRRPRIGILPLASSPLRTLPPNAVAALATALAEQGEVTLCLNRNQEQGRILKQALAGRLPEPVTVIEQFESVAGLLTEISHFDYAVYADSGPAHMSKLYARPGVAAYTSAPAGVLQGRFENLAAWASDYSGAHCRAPCGLAKLRQAEDGRIGCMGSLGLAVEALAETPRQAGPGVIERLLVAAPVPCVAALADDPKPLVDFVIRDFEGRPRA